MAAADAGAASGKLLWAKRYGTAARPVSAVDIAAAPRGKVCLAGTRSGPTGSYMAVVRYRADGRRTWARTYGGTRAGEEIAAAVASDRDGNVIVAGSIEAGLNDWNIVVIKYAPNGRRKWVRRYLGSGHANDDPVAMCVDRAGNVYVAATSRPAGTRAGILVLKYSPGGRRLWVTRLEATLVDEGDYSVADMALDVRGNAYVAGWRGLPNQEQALAVKLKRTDGSTSWFKVDIPGPGAESRATAIAVRGTRVVAAATLDLGADSRMMALGWSRAGTLPYRTVFDEGSTMRVAAEDVAIEGDGDVYVAGMVRENIGWTHGCAMRVLSDGTLRGATYHPHGNAAHDITVTVGPKGAVYLVWSDAWTWGSAEGNDILLQRQPLGAPQWVRVWGGPGHGNDWPCGAVLGTTGGLYVGGSYGASGGSRAVILKYTR